MYNELTHHLFKNSHFKIWLKHYFIRGRGYHCQNGVFGFKPKTQNQYSVGNQVWAWRQQNSNLFRLIEAFREHGHKVANINPVNTDLNSYRNSEFLDPNNYGVSMTEKYDVSKILRSPQNEVSGEQLVQFLAESYCGTIAPEFSHVESAEERDWLTQQYESLIKDQIESTRRKSIMTELLKSQAIDKFLAVKYVSLKRYGNEGAESQIAFFLELFQVAAEDGVENMVIGSHHRGRLNLLIGLLDMPPQLLFRKLQGKSEFPEEYPCIGDVISHLCPSSTRQIDDKQLHISMASLPSHLEAVCPVSLGRTRGLQLTKKEAQYGSGGDWGDKVINIQVHGDAAFMGQGVSQESLLMSSLPHFNVGGSVHLIINNQLGFTTPPMYGRGTRYATDLAKVVSAPVIHVNGDYPEDVAKATRLAAKYQRKFRKNVFIDMNCYRRWGHNELDDPTFTNPALYKIVRSKKTVPDIYAESLKLTGEVDEQEVTKIEKQYMEYLNECLQTTDSYVPTSDHLSGLWTGYQHAPNATTIWDTGVEESILNLVALKSVAFPQDFNVHPHVEKHHLNARIKRINERASIDWSTAEAMALGSLLYQGYNVRISGQDVGRGTFSHRHAMLVDQETNDIYIPLNNISPMQTGRLEVANSLLSEEAVLGFEYGLSTVSPTNLVIWEAQFGDFFNGAQIQVDTYITSGECKWLSMSSLVMLLPHGYDGAGPEHSSCRLERFLQLSDSNELAPDGENVNVHIVNPTLPAQYFHLLRRQMIRNYRKPLIVVAPKTLLRYPQCTSSIDEFLPDTHFKTVLGDTWVDPNNVTKVIFVTGKHYYALHQYREEHKITDTALIRLEQLCPFPEAEIQREVTKYKKAKDFVWSQEEPMNMGSWTFVRPRFENLVGCIVRYCGRKPLGAPAVGIGAIHKAEAEQVITQPFKSP